MSRLLFLQIFEFNLASLVHTLYKVRGVGGGLLYLTIETSASLQGTYFPASGSADAQFMDDQGESPYLVLPAGALLLPDITCLSD